MNRWARSFAACAAAAMICGCMTLHGGQRGKVVAESTYAAVPNLDVYLLVIKESRWLWEEAGDKSIARVETAKTSEYGDFKFDREPVWQWPLAQRVTEERVIVNLGLRSDLLMRSLDNAAYVDFWTDPQYVDPVDPRFLGMIITHTRNRPPAAAQDKPKIEEIIPNEYVRLSTRTPDLGDLELPRRNTAGP